MTEALAEEEWRPKTNKWIITLSVMIATFVDNLNSSIANVALKYIAGSYSISDDESLWIITMFLIACSILLPATGWCSKVFGRKNFFLFCIALFAVASFICGIAPNFGVMLLGRILQGLGGGCLLPISQAIIFESFPQEEQGKGAAVFGVGILLAPIIGPILGGWLTTNFSWNWVFFISVPISILSFFMVIKFVEDPPYMKAQGLQHFDTLGFLLLIIWISTFQVMVDNGQKNGWFGSAYICKLGIVSLISFITLIWWELKNKKPLFDLRIFKNFQFTIGQSKIAIAIGIVFASVAILPRFLQSLMGYDAYLSGLASGPMGVGSVLGIALSGFLSNKVDPKKLVFTGVILTFIACMMFAGLNLYIVIQNVVLPNILIGIGSTFIIIPSITITFSKVSNEGMTNASCLQNLTKNVLSAIGTSSVGVFVSSYSQIHQTYLVDRLTLLNNNFSERISFLVSTFMQTGMDRVTAEVAANSMIYKQLIQQSMLSAYISTYRTYALLVLIVIPLLILLSKGKTENG
jgi:DHA2 family multidrug resistance protein